jgi:hypothetical protein
MSPIEMPNRRRGSLLSVAVLLAAAATMAAGFTAVSYAGTCSTLTGFPGLLQRAGLVAAGPCATKVGGVTCQSGATCTTANRKPGKCKNIAPRGPANCACVETTVSFGLR